MDPLPVIGDVEPPVTAWVENKRPKTWEQFHCSAQRCVVSMASGTPVFAFPIGRVGVSLIRDYDTLAFVNMSPKQMEVAISDNVVTEDGVPVLLRTLLTVFREDPQFIKRIVLDPDAEARLLQELLTVSVQKAVRSESWSEMAFSEIGIDSAREFLSIGSHDF